MAFPQKKKIIVHLCAFTQVGTFAKVACDIIMFEI
jgi:hypothetical protein